MPVFVALGATTFKAPAPTIGPLRVSVRAFVVALPQRFSRLQLHAGGAEGVRQRVVQLARQAVTLVADG